ncbi:hypothetical protein ACOMHN_066393 [Nucella lapillus]
MALATNPGDFTTVRSPYNLQTQQKRIRHLRSISVRNLHSGAPGNRPLSRLQCYFTLHAHVNGQAFYESEKITGSTNPSWQSFDISQYEDQINLAAKYIVVRVWVGQQENFQLLIAMEVHLSGLHFLTDKLQQLVVKQSPNMVIFGMLDKEFIFINKEQNRIRNLAKRVSDLDLPSTLLPAVVKVEKGSVRNSYTTSALTRIQTILRAIKQMQTHARRYRRQIEDRLLASQENADKLEERENLHMSVSQLRQELLRRTTHLHQSQEKLHVVKEATKSSEESLQREKEQLSDHVGLLKEDNRDYIVKREQLVKENALLNLRRRQMLNELFSFIYPIREVSEEEGNRYFINSVRLPHAEELQGQDDTMVAVGLGYSCHLTMKMAEILGLPLRHPVDNRGSKSVIYDQVHSKLADKDREFPLYSKGKDKNHFNYGVFLLNKNISQLRYQCSIPTLDLRQTLQNLLTLMHKLGVRMEGDVSGVMPTFSSTPDGTALSRTSPNGSSTTISTSLPPPPPPFTTTTTSPAATNGDVFKSQEPAKPAQQQHHHHPPKASALTEVSAGGRNAAGDPRDHFDEAEDIFKPHGDDHFFRVGSSFLEDFSALEGAENHRLMDLQAGREEEDGDSLRVSALLQTASEGKALSPKTFQLLKNKRSNSSSSRRSGRGEQDENNSGENGVDADDEEEENNSDQDLNATTGGGGGGGDGDDSQQDRVGGASPSRGGAGGEEEEESGEHNGSGEEESGEHNGSGEEESGEHSGRRNEREDRDSRTAEDSGMVERLLSADASGHAVSDRHSVDDVLLTEDG